MRSIRKRRNVYAILFAVCVFLTAGLCATSVIEEVLIAVLVFGVLSITSLVLLVRQSRQLYAATLIWDNRILAVPSALISMPDHLMKQGTEETVVSTFGILIGSDIYQWGLEGVNGVRLYAVEIDKERMYLTFGDKARTMRIELLHGMTQKKELTDAASKLLHETGVTVEITGW